MGVALVALATITSPGLAAACGSGPGGFGAWVEQFKGKAAGQGISARAIEAGLSGVTYDANVVRLDRSQKSFKLSFEAFYARRVGPALLSRGRSLMARHAGVLSRVEKRFGVPPKSSSPFGA